MAAVVGSESFVSVLDQILAYADTVVPANRGRFEASEWLRATIVKYWRARSLLVASVLLMRNQHAEEALVVGRALFEESLQLAELQRADEKTRVDLLTTHERRSIEDAISWLQQDADHNPMVIAMLSGRLLQIRLARENEKLGKGHPFQKDKKAFARRIDRVDDYLVYQLASNNHVHGGTLGMLNRTVYEGETVSVYAKSDSIGLVSVAAVFAGRSLLFSLRSVAVIARWEYDPEMIATYIADLEKLHERVVEQLAAARDGGADV